MSSQGYLVAHVFTSNAMIPIEDATVTVTQSRGETPELLSIWITNESGRTSTLTIKTPEIELSQKPFQEQPFSLVNIIAEHPLYQRIIVNNVQIFPDTVSTQPLQLIPLAEFPEAWDQTEIFSIPPQDL